MTQLFRRVLFSCLVPVACLYAGPNSAASMAVDFVPETPAADSLDTFTTATTVTLAVRIAGAVNLDAYQFDVRYDTTILKFKSAAEDNPFASLDNFLKLNSGSTVGFICQPRPGLAGVLNIANTLIGEDSSQAPEGGGILAILMFTVVKQQTCTLFIEKGYAVDYEQARDSVTTYAKGVIRAVTTKVADVMLPGNLSGNLKNHGRNPAIVDVLGREIPGSAVSRMVTVSKGTKAVIVEKNRLDR